MLRNLKYTICYGLLIIMMSSCNGKKETVTENQSKQKLEAVRYLIKNFKNDRTNLFGPVKILDVSFVDKMNRSINTDLYKVFPFNTIISYRGDYEFDQFGHQLLYKNDTRSEYPFFDGIKYFDYQPSSTLHSEDNLTPDYSMHIKYPNQIHFNYKHVDSHTLRKKKQEYDFWHVYTFDYDKKGYLIKQQAFEVLYQSIGYTDTIIREENHYKYKDNRIVSKITIFDKNNPERSFGAEKFHGKLVTIKVPCTEDFEYDDQGRIIKWMFYQGNRSIAEHSYIYGDGSNTLKKKIEYSFTASDDRRVVNSSYKAIILFDKYENITRVDRVHSSGDTLNTQYIEYFKFDHLNNWTEKRIYLDGDKNDKGEVSIIATRDLTYYDE